MRRPWPQYEKYSGGGQAIPEIVEYNIGHSIIARSVFVGMREAGWEMKEILAANGVK